MRRIDRLRREARRHERLAADLREAHAALNRAWANALALQLPVVEAYLVSTEYTLGWASGAAAIGRDAWRKRERLRTDRHP